MKPTLFILAAGMGSRYGGLKQLDGLGPNGETIMDYSVFDAMRAGFGKVVFASYLLDGVYISNGPGNPEDIPEVVETIKEIRGEFPIFGISMGHELIALSYGAKTCKLKFGHRGSNHPVRNLKTGKVEIVNQNHGYTVDAESIKNTPLEITHINIMDNTVEGISCEKDKIFAVSYLANSFPGNQDGRYLFDQFISNMKEAQKDA